jgi:predicted metal-dependent phosphotriesterase family hydrolase
MLWRRFNDIKDLIEIVKIMEIDVVNKTGKYSHPFYNKRFPIQPTKLKELLESDDFKNGDNEQKTYQLSNWVYRNVQGYGSTGAKNQFNMSKDAYYYYKRMNENGY